MRWQYTTVAALLLSGGSGLGVNTAMAQGVSCEPVNYLQWQSDTALRERLADQGWQVRRIRVESGCYLVYARLSDGAPVKAYFNPRTLDRVLPEAD